MIPSSTAVNLAFNVKLVFKAPLNTTNAAPVVLDMFI
jgi:hypothetical protein